VSLQISATESMKLVLVRQFKNLPTPARRPTPHTGHRRLDEQDDDDTMAIPSAADSNTTAQQNE
jgi:hypothetical protein